MRISRYNVGFTQTRKWVEGMYPASMKMIDRYYGGFCVKKAIKWVCDDPFRCCSRWLMYRLWNEMTRSKMTRLSTWSRLVMFGKPTSTNCFVQHPLSRSRCSCMISLPRHRMMHLSIQLSWREHLRQWDLPGMLFDFVSAVRMSPVVDGTAIAHWSTRYWHLPIARTLFKLKEAPNGHKFREVAFELHMQHRFVLWSRIITLLTRW